MARVGVARRVTQRLDRPTGGADQPRQGVQDRRLRCRIGRGSRHPCCITEVPHSLTTALLNPKKFVLLP